MHLFQQEIITINFHAFYITKNGTLLCDATMTLIRQEKIGNILFLKQHVCFLTKMNINHFYPKMHTAAQISTKRPTLYACFKWSKFNPEEVIIFFIPSYSTFLGTTTRELMCPFVLSELSNGFRMYWPLKLDSRIKFSAK